MSLVDRMLNNFADRVAKRINPPDPSRPQAGATATGTGTAAGFFGPGTTLPPMLPEGSAPRMWQYPIGANLWASPRGGESTSFSDLRNLADGCDMARICIEMRKDQLAGLEWTLVPADGEDDESYAEQITAAKRFLERPDGENAWDAWLRMALEDVLVLDALSIYRRKARGGSLYALEIVDGASIKPILDGQGRTPHPPEPAYQQILYGMPYADLTTEELLYRPKNRRARSAYGYSPIEWIVTTINWYVKRQLFNLAYYTEGNVPEGFGTTPEGWTPDQIRQFQEWFDAVLGGRVEQQRKIRWVGAGFNLTKMREMNFEVAHEEWLARIITAAFQVSYQRFIQRVVRATAEQAASEQADLGLDPLKRFVSGILNDVLSNDMGMPFLRFEFVGGDQADEKAEAEKRVAYVNAGILSRDQVAELEGFEPWDLPLTKVPTVTTSSGPVPLDKEMETSAGTGIATATEVRGQTAEVSGQGQGQEDGQTAEEAGADESAQKADLARWRKKALKAVREGKRERAAHFASTAIAPSVHAALTASLMKAMDEMMVREAFEVASRPFRDGMRQAPSATRGGASGDACHGEDAGRKHGVPYP